MKKIYVIHENDAWVEPLRAANEITGTTTFSWVLLGETLAPVRSSALVRQSQGTW